MQRRTLLISGLGVGLGTGLCSGLARAAQEDWHHRSLIGLGTTLHLKVAHADARRATSALDAAVRVLHEIEASMSLFRPDSELSRLNRDGHLDQPSHHLNAVLTEALHIARHSEGSFDPTVQPLWQMWAAAASEHRLPSPKERESVRQRVGWQGVQVSDRRITLLRPGMGLTLNGIAQGYAADAVTQVLRRHGVLHALLDTGEHAAWGRNEHHQPWTLGIEDPHQPDRLLGAIRLDGRALATSADHRSAFTPDHRHHHILDPRLGDSPQALSAVTVLAPTALRADALTKVMFMVPPQQIAARARQWGVGVVWVDKQGRRGATPDVTLMNI